jgi:hypothetical protein
VLPAVLGKMKNEEVLAYDSQALGQHRASSGNTDPAKSNIFTYYGWKDNHFFWNCISQISQSCNIPHHLTERP